MRRTSRNGRAEARRSSNKEISALIQKARAQGWTVLYSGGGHLIFRSPDKAVPQIVLPSTPGSGNRAIENAVAKLKKGGLVMNRRRRIRRNPMKTSTAVLLGAAAAVGALFLLRRSARVVTLTAAGPTAAPVMNAATANAALSAMFGSNREPEIARIMTRNPTLSRAEAEARYNSAVASATSYVASRMPTSGIGSYYRT